MKKQNKTVDDKIRKELDEKFLTPNELGFREQLSKIIEPKAPYQYEIEINDLIRKVYKCFSLENPAQKCERDLMRKLDEVYLVFSETRDEEYKKVLVESFKRYDKIVNKKVPRDNNLIKLEDMRSNSTGICPEEMDMDLLMWKRATGIIE